MNIFRFTLTSYTGAHCWTRVNSSTSERYVRQNLSEEEKKMFFPGGFPVTTLDLNIRLFSDKIHKINLCTPFQALAWALLSLKRGVGGISLEDNPPYWRKTLTLCKSGRATHEIFDNGREIRKEFEGREAQLLSEAVLIAAGKIFPHLVAAKAELVSCTICTIPFCDIWGEGLCTEKCREKYKASKKSKKNAGLEAERRRLQEELRGVKDKIKFLKKERSTLEQALDEIEDKLEL